MLDSPVLGSMLLLGFLKILDLSRSQVSFRFLPKAVPKWDHFGKYEFVGGSANSYTGQGEPLLLDEETGVAEAAAQAAADLGSATEGFLVGSFLGTLFLLVLSSRVVGSGLSPLLRYNGISLLEGSLCLATKAGNPPFSFWGSPRSWETQKVTPCPHTNHLPVVCPI